MVEFQGQGVMVKFSWLNHIAKAILSMGVMVKLCCKP
jgi:hypothetical protein